MRATEWALLGMVPPSASHDAFHDYVTADGRLTDKGHAFQNFASEMRKVIAERVPKKPVDERMNIGNQINLALNDIRTTLNSLAEWAKTPDMSDRIVAASKARYQLDLALQMIKEHRENGISVPWADRKHQVEEEFSE